MVFATIAILLVIAGLVIRTLGSTLAQRGGRPGAIRLVSYAFLLTGLAFMFLNLIAVIDVGEVGVQHFLGNVSDRPLRQGVHVVNPFASIEKMSTREQSFPGEGEIEHMEAQTSEQLSVALDVALLYRIDGSRVPELFQRIGSEGQIKNRIVLNALRNGVRDAIATKSINDVFSPNRKELAAAMHQAIQTKAGDRILVIEVFVRDIQAPPRVKEAIEQKLQREQQAAAERFQTEIIEERARQKIAEAKGVAEAQRIVNAGLTDRYIALRNVEAFERMVDRFAEKGTPVNLFITPGGASAPAVMLNAQGRP